MRVLVVQNFDDEGLGQLGTALHEAKAELDLRRPYDGESLPADAEGHDALIVLGGGQNALDDAGCPYFPSLLSLMREFADSGRAVLGVCLGSQLLARAYGAENLVGAASEFGWHGIEQTAEGAGDPVIGALPGTFSSFQWHDDTFTLPPGAVRLATNPAAENQAFRIGRAAYGTQFHFEADRPHVARWNAVFADLLAERQPGWAIRHDAEAARHGAAADAAGLALARAWVAAIPAGMRVRDSASA
ncbi:type 1 glutamine amidotransferase [Mesorhizobium marinum]|uniref:Type 1 glutamine amidotransferase n=1 Tax=Mesorhizobium marinum TaxID=3228790 RepID=A0ABV3R326_9HYPH